MARSWTSTRWIAVGAVALALGTSACTAQSTPARNAEGPTASADAAPGPDAPAAGSTASEEPVTIAVPVKNVRVCVFNDLVGTQTGDITVNFNTGKTSGSIPVAGQRCAEDEGFSTILPSAGHYPEVTMSIKKPNGKTFYGIASNEPFLYPWVGFHTGWRANLAADAYFYENETTNMVVDGNRVRVTRLEDSSDAKNFEFHIVNN